MILTKWLSTGVVTAAVVAWLAGCGTPPNVSGTWMVTYSHMNNEVDTLTLNEQTDGTLTGTIDDANVADTTPVTGQVTNSGKVTIVASGDGTATWKRTVKDSEITGNFTAPSTPLQKFTAKRGTG